jgi:RES domain-containing protein
MNVYRIGRTKFAGDLTGEGARLNGGRWNHKLTPCLYASESKSLALLEYTVNVNVDDIPRALSFVTLRVPDTSIEIFEEAQLPGNWKEMPAPASTRNFGTQLLKKAKSLVIKIPSAVISDEWNYLINPAHPGSKDCKIIDMRDFVYDVRIKLK